ncbi:hypothetical protein OS493_033472 [Desmophyllum pertusum]|uniref:Uncharacterized protein n=1 Tax=Desmophyllum pertusum TaxID=174260 RepID=A0A9X0D0V3_9CNID|nr:hypothetical protein OS493_033472 [Desmophyllum pertusum]
MIAVFRNAKVTGQRETTQTQCLQVMSDLMEIKAFKYTPGREGHPSFPNFPSSILNLDYRDVHAWMTEKKNLWKSIYERKYSRIGPREFVPYEYDEMALSNIMSACSRHFASMVGEHMICDVLAGEQGPSCASLEQIPDLKVVHVRFIEANDRDVASVVGNRVECEEQPKRPFRRANAQSLPVTKAQSPSKAFPKSLSVLEMMKLGKVINDKSTESIELFTFDLTDMALVQPTFDGGIQHCQRAFWKRRVSRSV